MYVSDKKGRVAHPQYLLDGFNNIIQECQMSEMCLRGGKFTWEKGRNTSDWVIEKLDRGFGTDRWFSKFPTSNLKVVHTSILDHEPIVLELLSTSGSKKEFRFWFENIWLKEPSFVQEVSQISSSIPMNHLLSKIIEVTAFIARWGRSFFHKFRDKIKQHKLNLDKLVDRNDNDSVREHLSEKEKLNTLLLQEEIYWRQRAKLFWLLDGDDNTRFFHSSATARKKANKIEFLTNEEGERVEDLDGMCGIIRDYFVNLFTEEEHTTGMASPNSHRVLTNAHNTELIKDFTFEEFTAALKQMHPERHMSQPICYHEDSTQLKQDCNK